MFYFLRILLLFDINCFVLICFPTVSIFFNFYVTSNISKYKILFKETFIIDFYTILENFKIKKISKNI